MQALHTWTPETWRASCRQGRRRAMTSYGCCCGSSSWSAPDLPHATVCPSHLYTSEAHHRSWYVLACSVRVQQNLASCSHDTADKAGSVQGYLMQILSVKLGVATGLNMAQQCRSVLVCLWWPESIAAP